MRHRGGSGRLGARLVERRRGRGSGGADGQGPDRQAAWHPPPKRLFKYRSLAAGLPRDSVRGLLVHGRIYFAKPEDFNDPFECRLELDFEATLRQKRSRYRGVLQRQGVPQKVAVQRARAFFDACSREDWAEARKFQINDFNKRMKKYLGRLEIVSIGKSFRSKLGYPGVFVPCEIKLSDGTVRKLNLALKKHKVSKRFFVDGGI